ncbi:IS5 family transposase [Wolbachia endosymbiont of Psylliodes chrysocephala]|uniref:IS5 family transposase n=1 Tax=Wolbachia endosymbiont of Psylliodes chrysocephala TaxID=2883236 RepID=UPI00209CD91E|nr:IS5 family transposase [Wolbachia endosymbiont of Psylliodes chrysocephala]
MKYKEIEKLEGEKFRRLTGVKKATFERMVEILEVEDKRKKARSGRKSKLCIEDRLLMALEYIREYRTYFHIGQSYGMSESNSFKIIRWVEDILIKHPDFALPEKKELLKSDDEVLVIDGTETPVERPKKKQKPFYSGKKKRHTIKTQIVTEKKSKKVICTSFSNGRKHDFRMFRESKVAILPDTKILADAGYRGMQKIHKNVVLPHRKMKKNPLSKEQKKENRALMSQRAIVENVIGLLKRFKIISDRYRNRRKRFGLRFNLIAAIHNFELHT